MTAFAAPKSLSPAYNGSVEAPDRDCIFCPRLVDFRQANRAKFPGWFNSPVPSFGPPDAELLIIGLAPGLRGANRTGRPFTGDYAGVLLYETLIKYGFAKGHYDQRPDDGLTLVNCRITNAVRCVPPANKPFPDEIAACRGFLSAAMRNMSNLRLILALGRIAFDSAIRALGMKASQNKFSHGGAVDIGEDRKLFGSYHCSRYNTSTGRLTPAMFHSVVETIAAHTGQARKWQS